ncbi:hypothetical protein CCACVL1_15317 [Corchorus capsularis]|uniref:Uncharacterized protein n=1 Tax=Corchorus capsularis TaxID=210143 RepID=A0A1R3I2Q6_COCAP|nr:hypothetical protein CCACVL1_15317 [Corchorus capsularis]
MEGVGARLGRSSTRYGPATVFTGPDDAVAAAPEEPPRRKFKYIPIAVLEEQRKEAAETEAAENVDDEAKPSEADPNASEPTSRNDGSDEKPDMNDAPMEESQEDNVVRQDLNESTLDLNLGLTAHDGESDSNINRDGQLERMKLSSTGT